MKFRIFQILIILSVIIIPIQINEITGETLATCEAGTIRDEVTNQCVLSCGEGTEPSEDGKSCIKPPETVLDVLFVEIEIAIAVGVLTGIGATFYGIWRAEKTRREEIKKEDLVLIQEYGNKLTDIINTEKDLSTKLDCTLYAEQYLDTLEQIATLYYEKMLREDVADFFENSFRYGISVWKWYKKNLENYPDYEIEVQLRKGLENLDQFNDKTDIGQATISKLQSDRWFYFRWYCNGRDVNV